MPCSFSLEGKTKSKILLSWIGAKRAKMSPHLPSKSKNPPQKTTLAIHHDNHHYKTHNHWRNDDYFHTECQMGVQDTDGSQLQAFPAYPWELTTTALLCEAAQDSQVWGPGGGGWAAVKMMHVLILIQCKRSIHKHLFKKAKGWLYLKILKCP